MRVLSAAFLCAVTMQQYIARQLRDMGSVECLKYTRAVLLALLCDYASRRRHQSSSFDLGSQIFQVIGRNTSESQVSNMESRTKTTRSI